MIYAQPLLGQEVILVGAIGLALGLIYLGLRWRGHLDLLRRLWLPALLFAVFGTLDALVTIVGTWGAPWREGDPTMRAFLVWHAWVGLVIGTFLYVLFWATVVVGMESLRLRLTPAWARALGSAQLLTLYALAMGHLSGFLSWTRYAFLVWPLVDLLYERAPRLIAISPLGYPLYIGVALGGVCVALHLAIAACLGRTGLSPLNTGSARGPAADAQHSGESHGPTSNT